MKVDWFSFEESGTVLDIIVINFIEHEALLISNSMTSNKLLQFEGN